MTWDVTIGGNTISNIFEVNFSGGTDNMISATISCANNTNNRAVQSGEDVKIDRNSNPYFSGYVTGKPSKGGPDHVTLDIEATGKRLELANEQVSRAFYNYDTGKIVTEVVNKQAEFMNESKVTYADDLSDWDSSSDELSLGNITKASLYEKGEDFVFAGWKQGTTGAQTITFDNIPNNAVPGKKQLDRLNVRWIANFKSNQADMEVEYYTRHGVRYVWNVDIEEINRSFTLTELKVEDAVTDGELSDQGVIQFRLNVDGETNTPRAVGIDYITSNPFRTVNRDTDLDPSGVETTGRKITRRFDKSVADAIDDLSTEDNFISYATEDDDFFFEPPAQNSTAKTIERGTTDVVDASFNRDFRGIVNEVTVQGSGNIQTRVRDESSIRFYGVSPRSEAIIDRNIKTLKEAKERGRGYLQKNAWHDSAMKFEIANSSYGDLNVGEEIYVKWPTEDIDGDYAITSVGMDKWGYVNLEVTSANAA